MSLSMQQTEMLHLVIGVGLAHEIPINTEMRQGCERILVMKTGPIIAMATIYNHLSLFHRRFCLAYTRNIDIKKWHRIINAPFTVMGLVIIMYEIIFAWDNCTRAWELNKICSI